MALSWISRLVFVMLLVNTYARTLTHKDVANILPRRSSAKLFLPAHLSNVKNKRRNRLILPGQVKGNDFKVILPVDDSVILNDHLANDGTTVAPPVSTTLDPWDEFCREACDEGKAGPECDCAEHPIGRRHAPSVEELPQKEIPVLLPAVADAAEVSLRQAPRQVRPVSSIHFTDPDVMPSDVSQDEGDQSDGKDSATTKDPFEEFCDVACKEGVGSVACDCRGHIIG